MGIWNWDPETTTPHGDATVERSLGPPGPEPMVHPGTWEKITWAVQKEREETEGDAEGERERQTGMREEMVLEDGELTFQFLVLHPGKAQAAFSSASLTGLHFPSHKLLRFV